jgi:hypothetical protein
MAWQLYHMMEREGGTIEPPILPLRILPKTVFFWYFGGHFGQDSKQD